MAVYSLCGWCSPHHPLSSKGGDTRAKITKNNSFLYKTERNPVHPINRDFFCDSKWPLLYFCDHFSV